MFERVMGEGAMGPKSCQIVHTCPENKRWEISTDHPLFEAGSTWEWDYTCEGTDQYEDPDVSLYIIHCPFCGIKLPTTLEEIQKCLK
jgi:hypothetical protein